MYESALTSITLTLAFAALAAAYTWMALRRGSPVTTRVSDALHVVMCVAMIVMAWDPAMRVFPAVPQLVVFSAATLFYLTLTAVALWRRSLPDVVCQGYHASMMLAMVVMAEVMRPMAAPMGDHSAMSDMASPFASPFLLTASAGLFAAAALVLAIILILRMQGRRTPDTQELRDGAQHGEIRLVLLLFMTIAMGAGFALG